MHKILIVVGTRPNFIKVTRFHHENEKLGRPFDIRIVHTGQHYDDKMAAVFFDQFGLTPDFFLEVPSSSPNTQMAHIMLGLEKTINEFRPSLVMVPGDVNSTLAAAITCNKTHTPVAHIESGLRSFDRTMPEEFNRILTDEVSDYLFVTEQSGMDHLAREGRDASRVFYVGNTMIDTLVAFEDKIMAHGIDRKLGVEKGAFALMTMHRPATVDSADGLRKLIDVISLVTRFYPVVFPVHPRTRQRLQDHGLAESLEQVPKLTLTGPMDYFAFQKLVALAGFVMTDSGGIQEETTFRKVPCLTLRPNTERPSTVDIGTNELLPFDLKVIESRVRAISEGTFKTGRVPRFWDGKATHRILTHCADILKTLESKTG
jgi:UDP-N-acetylglucosamine 2-epimerase (non-hydrolysing)